MELQATTGDAVSVSDAIFGAEFKEPLVHQAVTAFLAGARSGTRKQKTRSDVNGGGRKPWRQKGTGRARAGTIRSPLWRTGGVTFAARPQDHSQKLNKKMYRAAMRSILSELVRQERLIVVDSLDLAEPKTKLMRAKLEELNVSDVLFVTEDVSENFYLASRNIYKVGVTDVAGLDPVSLVGHEKVVMAKDAITRIEEWLA